MMLMFLALSATTAAADAHSQAGVLRAEKAWEQAELSGDSGLLRELLAPGYISVGAGGRVTPRDTIVARARVRPTAERRKRAETVAAWHARHPLAANVSIEGDTAIVRWIIADGSRLVSSSDIFVYERRRWRAVYSQHSSAAS